ncbi:hemagglutinin/amebocyte aggregation factor-like [Osmerus eperlanus]|uniref:hemagglutinin/amebocyte aggregation factor-like n=1 Tax=Osmerus eperlanus TaxID=29151 RepID=UPI002E131A85
MKRANVFILLLAGVLVNGKDLRWQNNYDEPLFFNCNSGQSISHIASEHHNKHEDRVWDFRCKATFDSATNCFTSSYVNGFDKPLSYQCPTSQVITGMHSYHENKHEDRRWKFTCCGASNFCTDTCQWTNYVNSFDEAFAFDVPSNTYLIGVESYHENKHEDRRWKYQYCTRRSC